jgi:hypothetical protein
MGPQRLLASTFCGVLTGLAACVPATLVLPPNPEVEAAQLVEPELRPALGDEQLEALETIVVLPPACFIRKRGEHPVLILAQRKRDGKAWRARIPELRWRGWCAFGPVLLGYGPGRANVLEIFGIKRSGHLFTDQTGDQGQWVHGPTSTDLVGLREQLAASSSWTVVDEPSFAAWLGVDPSEIRPDRRDAGPPEGNSWFTEEPKRTDPQSGCPLEEIVFETGIYRLEGRELEVLLGPQRGLLGVLEQWRETLSHWRTPLLLNGEGRDAWSAWPIVGDQLVDYPRCTVAEIKIAGEWLEGYRRMLPSRGIDQSPAGQMRWLLDAYVAAVDREPPVALPNLAKVMARYRASEIDIEVNWARGSEKTEMEAELAAWFGNPNTLAWQASLLHDLAGYDLRLPVLSIALGPALREQVLPTLLDVDVRWWESGAEDSTLAGRVARDAFMLDHAAELPERERAQLDRLCIAAADVDADLARACAARVDQR